MQDEEILTLYLERDEQAIQQTAEKYGGYCLELADRILKNRQDAQETVNDTWLRAWQTIPPKRPGVLKLYLAKITRNLAFSRCRAQNAQKRGGGELALALEELEDCVGKDNDLLERVALQELTDCIGSLLEALPHRDRCIFIRRYFYLEEIGFIARQYGMKESNVLMVLSRVRKKLKAHLMMEGYLL